MLVRPALDDTAKWQALLELVHGKAEVMIGKKRHGLIGSAELVFEGRFTRFSNLAAAWQGEGGGIEGVGTRGRSE